MPKKLDRDRILAFVSIQVNEYYHNQGKIPYITRIREFSMVLFFLMTLQLYLYHYAYS